MLSAVLRLLSVGAETGEITEVHNFRAGRMNLNFSSNDVKWCPLPAYNNIIATAATNGALVIWDLNLNRNQKQGAPHIGEGSIVRDPLNGLRVHTDRVISEHQRAVNRISFHPTEPVILLSASQDGVVKLWDLRERSAARLSFECKAESVRDVQFSTTDTNQFVAGFENGTVQRWDIRQPLKFEQRINAHNGPVFAVEWHPEGRYLATGSRDKTIRVRAPLFFAGVNAGSPLIVRCRSGT